MEPQDGTAEPQGDSGEPQGGGCAPSSFTRDDRALQAGSRPAGCPPASRPAVVVAGSLNMDLVVVCRRAPEQGETVSGERFFTACGGKGANQAVAAARLGAPVAMLGCAGDDAFGDQLVAALRAEGIDTAGVRRVPGPSGVAAITVEAGGANRIVVVPGANAHFKELDAAARRCIASARVLLLQLESPLPLVEQAARVARAAGVTVILTPAPVPPDPLPPGLLEAVDWLVPNEHELWALVGGEAGPPGSGSPAEPPAPGAVGGSSVPGPGRPVAGPAAGAAGAGGTGTLEAAARRLGEGRIHVVVTLGERGCLYVPPAGAAQAIPALPVVAVDTTAAGDTFAGALAVALAEERPVEEALQFATRAAGISVTRPGAQPSMPSRAEVEAWPGPGNRGHAPPVPPR
ncbi:ribokinase [Thermaerobacter sp. PB12/4term]|uniref:ribokinase n=1 Tax=Thermaerobacter sp. PB12/4term TaxID=2293838 RepID=UPI000E32BAA7|nr:ribokinase [Thermaerobacter sp. PB12/4term]QIA28269.1 ribokinase [Thermaerobacter sp. PB12/4term]